MVCSLFQDIIGLYEWIHIQLKTTCLCSSALAKSTSVPSVPSNLLHCLHPKLSLWTLPFFKWKKLVMYLYTNGICLQNNIDFFSQKIVFFYLRIFFVSFIGDENFKVLYFTVTIKLLAGHQPFCLFLLYSNYISTEKGCKMSKPQTQKHIKEKKSLLILWIM